MILDIGRELSERSPELFAYVRNQLERVDEFPGTLGGGDLYVTRTRYGY